MRTKFKKVIFSSLIFCIAVLAVNSSAAIITIGIEAVVTGVTDNDNLLEGKVAIDSIITGTYTYDTSTLDTNPASDVGNYYHYTFPCGINWTVGGFVFKTDPDNTEFLVHITDNYQEYVPDYYGINSFNNVPLSNGVKVESIYWELGDFNGTALSSTVLPITAPVLTDWTSNWNNLSITGGIGGTPPCYEKTFGVTAEVISAVLVPEPMSLLLFGFGLLAVRLRRIN